MTEPGSIHTTSQGWTIQASETIAAKAAHQIKMGGGTAAKAAASGYGYGSARELRCRLRDHRLPPEPELSPEIAAALARPLPDMDTVLEIEGDGTEADLFRLCALAISLCRDSIPLNCLIGNSDYEPPAWIEDRNTQLRDAADKAMDAVAAIPTSTFRGLCAKAKVAAEWGLADDDNLSTPIVISLLRDCGAFDRPDGAHPGICKPGNWTPRKMPAQFVETSSELDRILASV